MENDRSGGSGRRARLVEVTALAVTLCGCGGGGGGDDAPAPASPAVSWTPSIFQPASSLAAQCAVPRTGTDPSAGLPYADVPGTVATQNNWLRSWSNELYLWYDEIADVNPNNYSTADYFGLMKSFATTASGAPKDKFHFTYETTQWLALSQSGVTSGYGAEWAMISSRPPREVVVAYTQPGSPADGSLLTRGARVLAVDGVDVDVDTQAGIDVLNDGLFPADAGEIHTFAILDRGSATPRDVTMQSTIVTLAPVQHVDVIATATGPVGYFVFTDHIATAEQALIDAVEELAAANVVDLVLDLRYNGGGFLAIASELAYMIAGPGPTAGRTFEAIRFNDKHPSTNPVTRQPLTPFPFLHFALGLSAPQGISLPTLNLPRVFVLTGATTCSASEAIINSLRGVGVEVIQIGSGTCGKPYGFYPEDNCGTTYFSIQFKGVNDVGFGDYSDGFVPANTPGTQSAPLPGCAIADDFDHALGDENEARLAAALYYRDSNGLCPTTPVSVGSGLSKPAGAANGDAVVPKSPWLMNRTLSVP